MQPWGLSLYPNTCTDAAIQTCTSASVCPDTCLCVGLRAHSKLVIGYESGFGKQELWGSLSTPRCASTCLSCWPKNHRMTQSRFNQTGGRAEQNKQKPQRATIISYYVRNNMLKLQVCSCSRRLCLNKVKDRWENICSSWITALSNQLFGFTFCSTDKMLTRCPWSCFGGLGGGGVALLVCIFSRWILTLIDFVILVLSLINSPSSFVHNSLFG